MSDHHHIVPIKVYLAIFMALMVLTAVTVWVAFVDLGALNTFVALGIAGFKAMLVILFFMHVKYSSGMTKLIVGASFFWFLIMIVFTFSDYLTRGWVGG